MRKAANGLHYDTTTQINFLWSKSDKQVALKHLQEYGIIYISNLEEKPIDNVFDIDAILKQEHY